MKRRTLLSAAAAVLLTGSLGIGTAQAADPIKVGVVGPKTGPLAAGAAVTHFPPFELWAHDVNARGGLKTKDGQRKIELIVYDDRTQPGEAIKAVQRLATQDEVDWIMAPYGTGFNVATAPIFDKTGYPQMVVAGLTDQQDELMAKFKRLFFFLGRVTPYADTIVEVLDTMRDAGTIGNRIAMVNVADTFGIEFSDAARPKFKAAGYEIVYDKSYPLGVQDLAPVVKAAKAAKPDAFIAFSYPPDTFGLAEQAKIEELDVKAYYSAVATAFPGFKGKFGPAAEGILGAGGVPYTPEVEAFYKRHKEVTGVDADYWGSPLYYAMMEIIANGIEEIGSVDRDAIVEYAQSKVHDTLMGPIDLSNRTNARYWTVGQWQGEVFHAVAGVGGARIEAKVKPKTGW